MLITIVITIIPYWKDFSTRSMTFQLKSGNCCCNWCSSCQTASLGFVCYHWIKTSVITLLTFFFILLSKIAKVHLHYTPEGPSKCNHHDVVSTMIHEKHHESLSLKVVQVYKLLYQLFQKFKRSIIPCSQRMKWFVG